MITTRTGRRTALVSGLTAAALLWAVAPAEAQDYRPGETIEYKVGGSVPVAWERGVVIRRLGEGKQILIHEKPSQFFPEGPEIAYALSDLRRPQATPLPSPNVPSSPDGPPKPGPATPPPGLGGKPIAVGTGLLSKEDVLAYAKRAFGDGDPFARPDRDAVLASIRDHVKARGTNFLSDLEFSNQLHAIGAYSVHIASAIEANYGPPPKAEDYFGTFLLRSANRGSRTQTTDGSRVVIRTEDAQFESGSLTIDEDGTYLWKVARDDAPEKWLRGTWRLAKPEEIAAWEGGPAIWLEKARQGEEYQVRACRVPGWLDWIDVGMGPGRTPIEYGRPE